MTIDKNVVNTMFTTRFARGTEYTEEKFFIENREIPILYKYSGLWPEMHHLDCLKD